MCKKSKIGWGSTRFFVIDAEKELVLNCYKKESSYDNSNDPDEVFPIDESTLVERVGVKGPKRAKFTFKMTYGSDDSTVIFGTDDEHLLTKFMSCIESGIEKLSEAKRKEVAKAAVAAAASKGNAVVFGLGAGTHGFVAY